MGDAIGTATGDVTGDVGEVEIQEEPTVTVFFRLTVLRHSSSLK